MTTLSKIIIAFAVAAALAAGVWQFSAQKDSGAGQQKPAQPPAVSGEQVPDISLPDYDGRTVRLSGRGQPLVVNSWAAWCPFCVKELADLVAVQEEFAGRVTFIAIDRAEPLNTAKEFTDGLGISDDLVFLLDPTDSFYRAIGGFSMPETLFVKADGSIHFHKRGPMTREEIRRRTQELVEQQ